MGVALSRSRQVSRHGRDSGTSEWQTMRHRQRMPQLLHTTYYARIRHFLRPFAQTCNPIVFYLWLKMHQPHARFCRNLHPPVASNRSRLLKASGTEIGVGWFSNQTVPKGILS